MKKLLALITLGLFLGCAQEDTYIQEVSIEVPKVLQIKELIGIKTEFTIVTEEVRMNVKLPYSGEYRIKVRDIEGTLISQEVILAKEGNNLLRVYVSTLPKSSYKVELADIEHKVLGAETIVVN